MKRIITFLAALVLLLCCSLPAYAAGEGLPYVCDTVSLLSDEQRGTLETQAETITEQFQCAVYFITVENYQDYGSGDIYNVAKTIYKQYDLGWGEEKSGVLLLLSMDDRDYSLIAYGYGNVAFTDYGKDYLSERFLDNFADNDWNGGCEDYIVTCAEMLKMARNEEPLDITTRVNKYHVFWISLILGFSVALIICVIWRSAAKKAVREGSEARSYLSSGGMHFTYRDDRYTHTTQTRTKIEHSSDSSGGGGTTVDSSGFSGKSGKF